jgi:hypothetical protein
MIAHRRSSANHVPREMKLPMPRDSQEHRARYQQFVSVENQLSGGAASPVTDQRPLRARPSPGEEITEFTRLGEHRQNSWRRHERQALRLIPAIHG